MFLVRDILSNIYICEREAAQVYRCLSEIRFTDGRFGTVIYVTTTIISGLMGYDSQLLEVAKPKNFSTSMTND